MDSKALLTARLFLMSSRTFMSYWWRTKIKPANYKSYIKLFVSCCLQWLFAKTNPSWFR